MLIRQKMEHFKPPSAMTLTGNVSENWRKWEQRFVLYMTAAELSKKSATVQVAVLLHSLGEEALEIYNTFDIAKEAPVEVTVDTILEAFRNYCTPKKNVVFERHQFWTCIRR